MRLSDVLNEKNVIIDLKAYDSEGAIRELGHLLAEIKKIKRPDDLIDPVLEREKLSSTSIGHGIAIPHAKTDVMEDLVCCLGLSRKGVDFKAGTKETIHIIFFIAGPVRKTDEQVQVLAAIARLCTDKVFRQNLMNAGTGNDAMQLIRQKESPVQN